DAATATVLYGESQLGSARARLSGPVLSARGEDGSVLSVPAPGSGRHVRMNGAKVFSDAVRQMVEMLRHAAAESNLAVEDLDRIVPHQANGRIIEAVRARLGPAGAKVVNAVAESGNTSSSTIPLVLAEQLGRDVRG